MRLPVEHKKARETTTWRERRSSLISPLFCGSLAYHGTAAASYLPSNHDSFRSPGRPIIPRQGSYVNYYCCIALHSARHIVSPLPLLCALVFNFFACHPQANPVRAMYCRGALVLQSTYRVHALLLLLCLLRFPRNKTVSVPCVPPPTLPLPCPAPATVQPSSRSKLGASLPTGGEAVEMDSLRPAGHAPSNRYHTA